MTVFERFGVSVCETLMRFCMRMGFTKASQSILNFAELHFLKITPTHFCKYKVFMENGKIAGFRCSKCGREERV